MFIIVLVFTCVYVWVSVWVFKCEYSTHEDPKTGLDPPGWIHMQSQLSVSHLPNGCWEVNSSSLEDQCALLTAEPSLQFLFWCLIVYLCVCHCVGIYRCPWRPEVANIPEVGDTGSWELLMWVLGTLLWSSKRVIHALNFQTIYPAS